MAIEVPAGTYVCTLMRQDDGTAAIGLEEHYEWNAAKRDIGNPCGGCQVLFGFNAYVHHPEAVGTDAEWKWAGKIVCDLFGYTLVQSNRMKHPGEEYAWRVDALADVLGITADQVYDIRSNLTEAQLLAIQFEVEVQEYRKRDGSSGLSVNWIGRPGAHGGGGTRTISGQSKNKALFAKFAAHARATRGGHAPSPAAMKPKAPVAPSAPAEPVSQRAHMPPPPAAPSAPAATAPNSNGQNWTGRDLWQRWLETNGDTSEQFYETIDKILGRTGVEPTDITSEEAEKVATALGWDMPF